MYILKINPKIFVLLSFPNVQNAINSRIFIWEKKIIIKLLTTATSKTFYQGAPQILRTWLHKNVIVPIYIRLSIYIKNFIIVLVCMVFRNLLLLFF